MHEEAEPQADEKSFELVRLCRYFSDLSPQPTLAVEGPTHAVRYLNAAFEHLAGKQREELLGRSFTDALPEGETNECLAVLNRVYLTGKPEIVAAQEYSSHAPVYWCYSIWPIFEADHSPVGAMIQVTDMTETMVFRKQVRTMNEQLLLCATRQHELVEKIEKALYNTEIAEKASSAKSEFLSRMSHELRTPLNAILGFGQILDRQQLTTRQKESVGYILKGGWHLLGLINEVLDITSIEKGGAEISLDSIALNDVIPEVCALMGPLAAERNIRLQQASSSMAHSYVLADRKGLKQVLINLLSNAIKYNHEGGRVAVTCHLTADERVQICVTDTGPGISAEDLTKLFTPFERLNAAESKIEGTGLGLVLSQSLVTAMGGDIKVESIVGQGSTFSIELPQASTSKPDMKAAE